MPAPTKISPLDTAGIAPCPPYAVVIAVAAQTPVEIVPIEFKLDAVVNDAKDVTSVATRVFVPEGRVTFVKAVVVSVKLNAPEVANVVVSAIVIVALVAGAVTVTLLYVLLVKFWLSVVPTIAPVGAATSEPVPVVYFKIPL